MRSVSTWQLCTAWPIASGAALSSISGFVPPPGNFIKPAPSVDYGITDGEYEEWFTPNAALLPEKCQYGRNIDVLIPNLR